MNSPIRMVKVNPGPGTCKCACARASLGIREFRGKPRTTTEYSVGCMDDASVLIVSTGVDAATDVVCEILGSRGVDYTRIDTETFPYDSRLTIEFAEFAEGSRSQYCSEIGESSNLSSVSSLWYRRMRSAARRPEMHPGIHDFCLRESRSALLGFLLSKVARAMSPPQCVWMAEHKVHQLAMAASVGLSIPHTIVTNDPGRVREAFATFRQCMIAKPVRTGFVDLGSEQRAIYTSQVLEKHLAAVDEAQWSPAIYQPLIRKRCDVRVTIVGRSVFAAEIDSQQDPDASVDWRRTRDPELPHRAVELPPGLISMLIEFMGVMGLQFGAIDLIRTLDDTYLFLEVNPNGQWLWIDDKLDLGISRAVAAWLIGNGG